MKVILDDETYDCVWNKIYKEYRFRPSMKKYVTPFKFNVKSVCYKLCEYWSKEQEKLVNDIFKKISDADLYALVWQHDCFEYNPEENIEVDYSYHDEKRNCSVCFPSYYPNGDYHFFVSKNFEYGMFGHPWRKEIYLIGQKLIDEFARKEKELNLIRKFHIFNL